MSVLSDVVLPGIVQAGSDSGAVVLALLLVAIALWAFRLLRGQVDPHEAAYQRYSDYRDRQTEFRDRYAEEKELERQNLLDSARYEDEQALLEIQRDEYLHSDEYFDSDDFVDPRDEWFVDYQGNPVAPRSLS
jgi:hypothetical protein